MNVEIKGKTRESELGELTLLKLIPSDLKVFDSISVSSGQESDLSGPFSDYEKIEAYIEKRKSEDIHHSDIYSYFSFSEEFISAMESIKSEMEIPKDATITEILETDAPEKVSKIQLDLEKKASILFGEIMAEFKKKVTEDDEEKKSISNLDTAKGGRKTKTKDEKKKAVEDEEEYYDTMSGYWRILGAYDNFRISPPYYNAYENEEPHWLETKQIDFRITESARKKCIDWLKNNFEN